MVEQRTPMNKLMNQVSEFWYIGSQLAMSATQKYRIDARTATGI